MPFRRLGKQKEGQEAVRIYSNSKACRNCPNRDKCTTYKREGRRICRNPHENALDVVNVRMNTKGGREIFRERKKIVEHPFGTTKAVWGFKQFLCRGREKTSGEASLVFLAYNLRRVINIFKANGQNLIEAMA